MVSVITSFSRITILSFVLIFTAIDIFQMFEYKMSDSLNSILSTIQAVIVVVFLINGSVVLFISKNNVTIIGLLFLELMLFTGIVVALYKTATPISRALINNVLLFMSFGFLMLERLKLNTAVKQLGFTIASLIITLMAILIIKNVKHVSEHIYFYAGIGIVSLLLVSILGRVEYGARTSFAIMGIRIQPSEFVKLSFIFFIAAAICTYRDYRGFAIATIGSMLHVIVLVFSKDLGSALIFLGTYAFLIFIAYKNYIVMTLEFVLATIGGILAFKLFPHIQTRFIAWSDPLSVIDDKGYQISQSLFAIGTPGWLGTGLNNGMPNKIPIVTNDFIFAAIAEEMGNVVAVCLIIMFMCTVFILLMIAHETANNFYMLVVSGIGIIFAIQTILNIGGVIKFIPSTGVTLPFVSNGGSSMLSMMICLFIAECSGELANKNTRGTYER